MRLKTWHTPRANAVKSGPTSVNKRVGPRDAVKSTSHQTNALSLLSVGDATTGELAEVLELSAPYLSTLLGRLELEGRIESRKDGRRKVWTLP